MTSGLVLVKKKWNGLIFSSKNVNGRQTPTSYYSPQLYFFFFPKIPQTEVQGEGRQTWKKDFCFIIAVASVSISRCSFWKLSRIANLHKQIADSSTHTHLQHNQLSLKKKPYNFTKLLHLTAMFKMLMPEAVCFAPLPRGSVLRAASEGNVQHIFVASLQTAI